jgi:long-chain acyl-CoA synthetase
MESMVYAEADEKRDEIIAALIVPDAEAFIELSETRGVEITDALMKEVIGKEVAKVNGEVVGFKQIRKFYLMDHELEKTTTQKVKRYLVKKTPGAALAPAAASSGRVVEASPPSAG